MSTPLIETVHLKKYFKTNSGMLHAVDDVNLSVQAGETLGIVGESGCGKSTLGRLILRLLDATSGEVRYNGENILTYNKAQMRQMRKELQIIFQDPYSSLNPRMTVSEIIAEPMRVNGMYQDKTALQKRVSELMDTVGLASRLENAYPHELDGGRRQRIGIARALSVNPKFIVCDEPVSALDVSIQAQILNLLKDLQEELGLTYIFIAHGLPTVQYISDRIAVMYLGKIMELAPEQDLFAHTLHPYTEGLLSAIPVEDPTKRDTEDKPILEGDLPSPLHLPKGCRFCARCKYAQAVCQEREPELKEALPGHYVCCHFPLVADAGR